MHSYAAVVNCFRILCPDGTYREPSPREVAGLDPTGAVRHARRIVAETVSEIAFPTF